MIGPFDFLMLRKKRGEELEVAIDAAIRHAAAWQTSPITVPVSGWPIDVIAAVIDEYRKLGWRAEFNGGDIQLELPA